MDSIEVTDTLVDELMEDWKYINETYQVSSLGEVRSIDRVVACSDGRVRHFKGTILKPYTDKKGYKMVALWDKTTNKHKGYLVHRLVAQAFIPNPDNLPDVNHKDEDKGNNRADNLEWCTNEYNHSYGNILHRQSASNTLHTIGKFSLSDELLETYSNVNELRKLGYSLTPIYNCCNNKKYCKTAYGYKWRYIE